MIFLSLYLNILRIDRLGSKTDFSTKNQDNVCFFQPKTIHDRTQVFLGNSDEIEELQKYLKGLKWKKIDWERGDLDSKIDQ